MNTENTKEKFTPKIFVSNARGYSPQDNEAEPVICKFTPFKISHPVKGDIDAGHYFCLDEKIYDRLMAHPDLNKGFRLVKKLPSRTNSAGQVVSGVVTGGQETVRELSDDERMMARELGNLEAKFLTEEGNLKGNVKKDSGEKALARIQQIKTALRIA